MNISTIFDSEQLVVAVAVDVLSIVYLLFLFSTHSSFFSESKFYYSNRCSPVFLFPFSFLFLLATSMDDIKADLDEMLFGDKEDAGAGEDAGGHHGQGALGVPREKLRTDRVKKK